MSIVGKRVRVRITNNKAWHFGAFSSLQGAEGPTDRWGREREPVYTVRFDAPREPWHNNAGPVSAFHFEAADLEVL